jgi:hypothetical protein
MNLGSQTVHTLQGAANIIRGKKPQHFHVAVSTSHTRGDLSPDLAVDKHNAHNGDRDLKSFVAFATQDQNEKTEDTAER